MDYFCEKLALVTICHTIYSRFFDAPSDYISSFPSLVQNLDTCPNIDEHFGNLISLPTPIFPHLAAMRLRKADSRFSESLPRPYTSLQTIYDKANTVKTGPLKFHSAWRAIASIVTYWGGSSTDSKNQSASAPSRKDSRIQLLLWHRGSHRLSISHCFKDTYNATHPVLGTGSTLRFAIACFSFEARCAERSRGP